MGKNEIIVKKHIQTSESADVIRIGQTFRREFLSLSSSVNRHKDDLIDIPIVAIRIIFKIISDLRHIQFMEKNIIQFSLFDDDFKTDNNSYAQFKLKVSEVNGGSKNWSSIKGALEFLVKYKEDWYKMKNSKGKDISVFGGLIKDPSLSEGNVSFLVSSYWMERLMFVDPYNETVYNIAWKISSSKQMLFYLWLLELKEHGTTIKYTTVNDSYNLNYSSARDVAKEFLKPMRKNFDKYGSDSFNYSVKGDKISIVPYKVAALASQNELKPETVDKLEVKQRISYWKKRHGLETDQTHKIKIALAINKLSNELLELAYKDIVKKYRLDKANGKKITDLKGNEFLKEFQSHIIQRFSDNNYKETLITCPDIL